MEINIDFSDIGLIDIRSDEPVDDLVGTEVSSEPSNSIKKGESHHKVF